MNLHSKKARVPIAALGVAALCTAGMGVLATSAQAATTLTLNPTATSATITDLGVATASGRLVSYGLQLSNASLSGRVYAAVTGPTGGSVQIGTITSGTLAQPPGASSGYQTVNVSTQLQGNGAQVGGMTGDTAGSGGAVLNARSSNYFWLASTVPGTYTVKLFQDEGASNGVYDPSLDDAAGDFTLTVKDVQGADSDASNDLTVNVTSTPGTVDQGEHVYNKITIPGLTTTDVRGAGGNSTYPAGGVLGNDYVGSSPLLRVTNVLNGSTTVTPSGALEFVRTTGGDEYFDQTSGALNAAGSVVTTASIGTAIASQATSTVNDNSINTVAWANTDTANAKYTSSTATLRAANTTSVTYRVKATNSSSQAVSGKNVFFNVQPGSGTTAADLTTSAGTPDSNGDVGVNTDSDGYATITVTSAKTANTNAYTVTARSNGHSSGMITSTYATAAATSIKGVTSLAAQRGGTATITGMVVDQWGQPISPAGTVVQLTDTTGSGANFTPSGTAANYAIDSAGNFSATVTDGGPSTSNHNRNFTAATTTGTATVSGVLSWVQSVTPTTASLTGITSVGGSISLPVASTNTDKVHIADSASTHFETLSGVVKDAGGNGLPYTSVTYSGSDGVYFFDASGKLVTTLTAPATGAGALADFAGTGVRVVFTKSGSATVTIKAGSAMDTATLPVQDSTDSWKVTADDIKSKPSQAVTLTGTVKDAFGNPVVGRQVTLALSTISAGSLTGTDANGTLAGFQVITDSTGTWSTPFTSTANQSGTATLTATLANNTTPPNANLNTNPTTTAYSTLGLTIAHGEYTDQASIDVEETFTEMAVTGSLIGGGKAQLSGTAEAGASVDIYARTSGESGFSLVKTLNADSDGTWGIGATLTKTTSYFARSNGKTSDTVTSVVYSYESVSAKALGKGKVRFTVLGTPNVKGVVNIYYGSTRLAHMATDSHGDVTVDVKAKAGKRTFLIYFVAPGTSLKGKSLTGTVK